MGIGKYLHRKKDDSPSPQQSDRGPRAVSQGDADTALGTSRYEATAPGSSPETGTYPMKGNNNTAVPRRRGSIHNPVDPRGNQFSRPETAPPYSAASTAPRLETPPTNDFSDYHFFDQPQTSTQTSTQTTTTTVTGRQPQDRQMEADTGLALNFSNKNMNHDPGEFPTASSWPTYSCTLAGGSATPPPISYYPNSGSSRLDPRVDSHFQDDPSARIVNQSSSQQPYGTPRNYQRATPGYYDNASRPPMAAESRSAPPEDMNHYDSTANSTPSRGPGSGYNDGNTIDVRRRDSIPRKQIGNTTHTPSASVTSASPRSAGFPAEGRDQQAPPVPQHDLSLSQQARHQDDSAETQQYRSSPRKTHSKMPSTQKNRYDDSSYGSKSSMHDPQQLQRDGLSYQDASHQEVSGAGQQYTYPYETQSTSRRGEYSGYTSDGHHDGYVAPLSVPLKHASKDPARGPAAEDIVERAKTNTYDTEVIEKIAPGQSYAIRYTVSKLISGRPAVVHETVQQRVHHVREEVITREIHTHDVFHRILPVIDVEVLPPRHFLPVEGGGLVEIGADEVPGRGNNWVIAETASKIPSDQPAPKGVSRFTARQYPGTEGDAVQYMDRKGVEHTETTWVHPPALETGGRDTGQTWPMVFGKDSSSEGRVGHPSSKHAKSRSNRRSSIGRTTDVAQGPG